MATTADVQYWQERSHALARKLAAQDRRGGPLDPDTEAAWRYTWGLSGELARELAQPTAQA